MALSQYIKNGYLTVFVSGKGYVPVSVSKLTDDEIRKALTNGRNQNVLKSGWSVGRGGAIVRTPSATMGAVKPLPTAPTTPPPAGGVVFGGGQQAALAEAGKPPLPAVPTYNANAYATDPSYWANLSALRGELGLVDNNGQLLHTQAQAGLTGLRQQIDPITLKPMAAGSVGGKTLYDILYDQQTKTDARNLRLTRSDAARRGVTLSGYWDRTRNELGSQSAQAHDQLIRGYGTDINDARSAAAGFHRQQQDALNQYNNRLPGLQVQSNQSALDQRLADYQRTYGGY